MSHIFISYSRRDLDIAQKIVDALVKKDVKIWVDWKSIPKGEDWEQEIYRGINEAEAFLFLISPDSVASEMCNKEIAHAVQNGKRILPIFISKVDKREVYGITDKFPDKKQKDEINRRNFIFCRDGMDDFDKAIEEIQTTIETDYEWLKFHTRLQVNAVEWESSKKGISRLLAFLPSRMRSTIVEQEKTKRDDSRLLRGKELREAEEKFSKTDSETEPQPTELQRFYLASSQKHEKVVRRRVIAASVVSLLTILIATAWPTLTRERAIPGKWVTIPGGEFTIGMDKEEAETAASLCQEGASETNKELCPSAEDLLTWSGTKIKAKLPTFDIMDNEVTNAQYQQCIEAGACVPPTEWKYDKGGANKPAAGLDWFQAGEYCTWLGGRLPTEGEWEKAAVGPGDRNNYFPWGDTWDPLKANLEQSKIGALQSIAAYAESDISYYLVKNLAGNVREWTASGAVNLSESQVSQNIDIKLEDVQAGFPVIVRGGAWDIARSAGMVSMRGADGASEAKPDYGFRCACPPGKKCDSPWDWRWIWFGRY